MLDLTRLARVVGFLLVAYLLAVLLGAIVVLTIGYSTGSWPGIGFMWWGAVWVFPVGALVLAVDFYRRLGSGRLTVTQVPSYRVVAVLTACGAAFGLSVGVWVPVVICLAVIVALCVPTRGKAAPSTWTPR